jgi:hypothetical protein
MSLPVQYLKRDPHSDPLSPKFIAATAQTAELISVNWLQNRVSALNSPLLWYGSNECFKSAANQEISNADVRLENGILNFSVKSSYSFTPSCMSFYGLNDYFWDNGIQGNFTLVERVSFKLHTKELDNNPGPQIPFRVQNMLGYGVFTMGKLAPSDTGNIGLVDNEKALPIIHDFSNGKVLTYHLGGLPEDWTRDILIEGTKQVIQEWNASLRMSFKGTSLERSGDYIVLKVDGIDAEPGRLGDLDRNYIWNFAKGLDSGPLGMAQPGPNPRSGRIEHNNVLMYSGNLLRQLGTMREIARLQLEHKQMKEQVLADFMKAQEEKKQIPADPEGADIIEDDGSETPIAGETLEQAAGRLSALARRAFKGTLETALPQAAAIQTTQATPRLNVGPQTVAQLRRQGILTDSGLKPASRKERVLRTEAENAFLYRIMNAAFKAAPGRTQSQLEAITAAEVLKAFGSRLNEREKRALSQEATLAILRAEFEKNFMAGPNCVKMGSLSLRDPSKVTETSIQDAFRKSYILTLSHEIGHALGLTHNFIASTDKANFTFAGEEKNDQSRNYSSVMDYFPDDHVNYHGPGPYDVRALRVAYTGLIELDKNKLIEASPSGTNKNVKFKVRGREFQATANDRLEVSIDQLRAATVGDESLWKLTSNLVRALPLKDYKFCTDYQAGMLPLCTRWDSGTTPREVVDGYIEDYKNMYVWRNNIGNRINGTSFWRYLSAVWGSLEQMRLFLDETIYKHMEGSRETGAYLFAALTARNALIEIVSTPDTNLPYGNLGRFEVIEAQLPKIKVDEKNGNLIPEKDSNDKIITEPKIFVVERRNTKDHFDSSVMMMKTRGIEYDKALALMMLTERRIGHPRYDSAGISISFPELEKMVEGENLEDSATLVLLKSLLTNTPQAKLAFQLHPALPYTSLLDLSAQFEVRNTDLTRYYALLGSTVLLDADSPEDKYNSASLFRVLNSKSVVPGRLMVTKIDQDMASPASVKLFAMDNATISEQMVKLAAGLRVYVAAQPQLSPLIKKMMEAATSNNQAATAAELRKLAVLIHSLNKDKTLFSDQEAAEGRNAQRIALEIAQNSLEIYHYALQIRELLKQGVALEPLAEASKGLRANFAQRAKTNTSFAAAHTALSKAYRSLTEDELEEMKNETPQEKAERAARIEEAKMSLSISLIAEEGLAVDQYNYLINQLGAMNRFFYMLYPEQN